VFVYPTYTQVTHKGRSTVTERGENPHSRHGEYYRNVADHLTKGARLVITPEWSRRPIHVLDLGNRSAAAGRAMKAKYR